MKQFLVLAATAALLLFGSSSHARGARTSSFAPHGPEPHVSLSDMHHSSKTRGQGAPHKSAHKVTPKTTHRPGHSTPRAH
jgi:hypothetical protein